MVWRSIFNIGRYWSSQSRQASTSVNDNLSECPVIGRSAHRMLVDTNFVRIFAFRFSVRLLLLRPPPHCRSCSTVPECLSKNFVVPIHFIEKSNKNRVNESQRCDRLVDKIFFMCFVRAVIHQQVIEKHKAFAETLSDRVRLHKEKKKQMSNGLSRIDCDDICITEISKCWKRLSGLALMQL